MLFFVPEPNVLLSIEPHIISELRITTSEIERKWGANFKVHLTTKIWALECDKIKCSIKLKLTRILDAHI